MRYPQSKRLPLGIKSTLEICPRGVLTSFEFVGRFRTATQIFMSSEGMCSIAVPILAANEHGREHEEGGARQDMKSHRSHGYRRRLLPSRKNAHKAVCFARAMSTIGQKGFRKCHHFSSHFKILRKTVRHGASTAIPHRVIHDRFPSSTSRVVQVQTETWEHNTQLECTAYRPIDYPWSQVTGRHLEHVLSTFDPFTRLRRQIANYTFAASSPR